MTTFWEINGLLGLWMLSGISGELRRIRKHLDARAKREAERP